MPRALRAIAVMGGGAGVILAAQLALEGSRARLQALPRPAMAAVLFWLLWAPLVWLLQHGQERWIAAGISPVKVWPRAALLTVAAAYVHAAAVAAIAHLLARRFTAEPLAYIPRFLGLLPRSLLAALILGSLVFGFASLAARQESERRAFSAETQRLRAELEALRRQLEPHFLFNALNSIVVELRRGDADLAEDGLLALSGLLRRALDHGRREVVSLASELEFARQYAALAKLSYGNRLSVGIECDRRAEAIEVPSMILQPLLENALRHGLSAREGAGRIAIGAHLADSALVLSVEDDGSGLPEEFDLERRAGVGLGFVLELLRRRRPAGGSLRLVPGGRGGTRAVVHLPLAEGELGVRNAG